MAESRTTLDPVGTGARPSRPSERPGAGQSSRATLQKQTGKPAGLDLAGTVTHYPWATFGASIALGFLLGRIAEDTMEEGASMLSAVPGGGHKHQGASTRRSALNDLVGTVKLALGAAATDFVRDTIQRHLPQVGQHLEKIWKDQGLTPLGISSSVFGGQRR